MADMDIALQGNTTAPRSLDFSLATPLEAANRIQTGQTQLQMLNRQSTAQGMQLRNQLIANAAAHALDADSWDAAMQAAVKQGAPEAAQYIGRYTPLLQQRLFESYSGAPPAAQGATPGTPGAPASGQGAVGGPTDQYDRLYQNVPPDKMATSLQKLNMVNDALMTVRDPQSWDAAMKQLIAAGIPQAQQFSGAYSPLRVQQLWQSIQPVRAYLQDRMTADATGVPNPMVPKETYTVNGVAYDKYTNQPVTPPEAKKIGADEFGRDIYGVPDQGAPGGFRRIDPSVLGTGTTQPGGVDIAEATRRIQGTETAPGSDPGVVNPRSGATGKGQFIASTWLETIKAARPDLAKKFNDQQLLALRAVPELATSMGQEYTKTNLAALADKGIPANTATLALAYKFGAGGADKIFNANPGAKFEELFPPKTVDGKITDNPVIAQNPELKGQTVGAYSQNLVKQVGADPVNGGAGGGASNAILAPNRTTSTPAGSTDALNLHGEDYLKTLPTAKADLVRQIVEGRSPFPSGFILKTPMGQWLSQAVAQTEPSFTAADWNMRNAVIKEWNAGGPNSMAGTLTAGNTAIQHLGHLSDAAEKLENWSGWGVANGPLNWATSTERSYTQDPRVTAFDSWRNKYIEEATKFYRSVGGNEADLKRDIESLNAAQSPEQLRVAVAANTEAMQSKINALQARWTHAMTLSDGRVIEPPFPIIQDESQTAIDKIKSRKDVTGSAPASSAPNAAPSTPSLPRFATPDAVRAAVSAKALKSGDHFLDANGVNRMVP